LEGGVEVAEGIGPGFDGELGLLGHGAVALIVEGVAEAVVGFLLQGGVGGFECLGEGADGGVKLLEFVGGAAEAEGEGGALLGARAAFEAFAVEFGSGFEVVAIESAAGLAGFLSGGI
jgi:NADH:ubiquinone oxidoreductase subunit F (NADH-binding)